MKRKRTGAPFLVLAALVLVVWFVPQSSDTAAPDRFEIPIAFDVSLLHQDLTAWMSGRMVAEREQGLAVSTAALDAALQSTTEAQPTFFGRDDPAAQREVLRDLPYGATLAVTCERNGVDPLLMAAVVETESQFVADAVSPEGAVGLMQLLPSTGRLYGIRDLYDPVANLDAGSRYFAELLRRFHGNPELALAAYNTGPEVVSRYGAVPPYRETRGFVRKVMSLYRAHQDQAQGIALGSRGLFAHRALPIVRDAA
jgi:soluble lytic murein transglycosylase-like protein